MGTFLESEKGRYECWKPSWPLFSPRAREPGLYKGKLRPFCLPVESAEENLAPEIRQCAMSYFAQQQIKWHDGHGGKPSNHLCDSQVCCVNFLLPFADKPGALAALLRPLFPALREMLPIEAGQYVACEWIGERNYLHEVCRNGVRSRGANYTSADAAVMFEQTDGRKQVVLIEWKYTEAYFTVALAVAASGTSRVEIYRPLLERADCPIDIHALPNLEALFYEPFYQLMRQQLLAHEMERAHELGADMVSLLHVAPSCNSDFRRVTSPGLKALGASATEVWGRLVRRSDRFKSVSTEELFGSLTADRLPELREWIAYVHSRYPWVRTTAKGDASCTTHD